MIDGSPHHLGLLVSGRFAELEDALCERVDDLRRGHPLVPLTVVVGSGAVRTRVGDLLVRRLGAVANVRVVTLARLAGDLATAARGAPPKTLAGLARERLLRRLLDTHRDKLTYFGPVVDRPHFAAALAATLADLREGCVDPGSGWHEAVAAGDGTGTTTDSAVSRSRRSPAGAGRRKAADLDLLYRSYCNELDERRLLDGAGVQVVAAEAARSGGVRGHVIVYGIYDLNEAQGRLLRPLVAAGADVFVPVPRGRDGTDAAVRDVALAAGLVERPVEVPPETSDLDRIAALWRDGAATAGPRLAFDGAGALTVASVPHERAETREAVRSVLAAAAAGASLWDCAIVVPRGDDVDRMAAALEAASLPIACRRPDRDTGPRLLRRLCDCLAPEAGGPFARRAVVDLLATAPLLSDEAGPVARALWLDEARRAGVVGGLDTWEHLVGRRRRGLETRLAELEASPPDGAGDDSDEAAERVENVRLRLAAARGLQAAAGALARACRGLPTRAPWSAWADALAALVEALFERSASDAARDSAGRLRALTVVGEEVTVDEVAAALRELLDGGSVPVGRAGRDGVAVLTPLDLRGLRFHTVVFAGLAEGGFPVRGRPDPLLGDAERLRIDAARGREADKPGAGLPLAARRADESLLLFAFACEAARERLVLLAPRSDAATGRPRLPSRLLLRLASLGAGRPVGQEEFLGGKGLGPVWRRAGGSPAFDAESDGADAVWIDARERDTAVLLSLSEDRRRSAAGAYLTAVLAGGDDRRAGKVAAARRLGAWRAARSPEAGAWDGLLGSQARRALAARHPFALELSPTRLERYVSCPFAFMLRDVFGLDIPDEPGDTLEIDHLEFGTLAHTILQRAYRRVIDDGLSLDGALVALDDAWRASCAEAESRGVTGAELSWAVRRDMLLEDLRAIVADDPVFSDDGGRPAAVEWDFGAGHGRPVVLDLDGGRRISFRGRIDRFDATPLGARIIDYKTGSGATEDDRLKARLGVQLPVYQLAVRQSGAGEHDEVWCVYRFVTRRGGFRDLPLPDDEDTTSSRLRELVSAAVELVDSGMFPRTASADACKYCDARYACGASGWALARKRRDDVLQPLVRLQGGVKKGGAAAAAAGEAGAGAEQGRAAGGGS